jgi:predicted DNA-binding transcriptional regulator AlpA
MKTYSTREAAKKLGLHPTTLADHIASGKLPSPTVLKVGTASLHAWTEKEIEQARKLLPKIANGRKTRYQKKQSAVTNQQSAKGKPKKKKRSRNQEADSSRQEQKRRSE